MPAATAGAQLGELGVQRLRPEGGELRLPPCAGRGGRRAQVELGQRGAQVEPGPADDERAPPGGQRAVDLGVRQGGVGAGAEGLGHRHDAEQAVLEAAPAARASRRR